MTEQVTKHGQVGAVPAQPFAEAGGPLVFGHRGWSGRFPESTLPAFEAAVALGVDALEMDVHCTRDGVLVVHHDDQVDRTTNGRGAINELTLAELRTLDAGYVWSDDGGETFPFRGKGIVIPTLAEIFAEFGHLWINVDLKQVEPSIVRPFAAMIREYDMAARMFVGSFNGRNVAAFRREMPEVATASSAAEVARQLLLSRLRLNGLYWGRSRALQIPEMAYGIQIVTPRFVRDAHANGTAVHVWTVNEVADMERLLAMGVDGIMSDHPDRLLRLLGRLDSE